MSEGNQKGWTFDTLSIAGLILAGGIVVWVRTLNAERAKAIDAALAAANEKSAMHNDLIRKGERDNAEAKATYITWTSARAVLLTLVGIATLAIAYANLAPVFGVPRSVTVENPPSNPVPVDPAPKVEP